ncbi:MAG: transketolase [Nitrososphaerales archaeon]
MSDELQVQTDIELDKRCINTIRFLSLDMVQKAKSGHAGTPMGAADMTYTLWDRFLKHNPRNPEWVDRDRFILSQGHACAMLYSLLFLTGYDLSLDELRNFRQWGSKTPGHPEYGLTPGVDVTTGPLGQGFAHGVGMAMAEKFLADHYNREGYNIFDHFTYATCSDGDLQEGVTSEAASLAGTLRLGKLIYLYDDNGAQIDTGTDVPFSENVAQRFRAYGWQVLGPLGGVELDSISSAIKDAQEETERPTLIICRTLIGHYAPKEGIHTMHSDPIPDEEVKASKASGNWPTETTFYVPDDVLSHTRRAVDHGKTEEGKWNAMFDQYSKEYPDLAERLKVQLRGDLPVNWDEGLDDLFASAKEPMATREASGKIMNTLAKHVHGLVGGSADVGSSTKTVLSGYGDFGWHEYAGHNIHFGVREHAMGCIAGGMALHGGIIPYTATYFNFSDYMREPMRLAALMKIRVIYIFSHDSIGVGQDGPTHQPVEQLMSLREVPNMILIRPADAQESVEAWRIAMRNSKGPTVLVFTRQKIPLIDHSIYAPADGARYGGYVLWDTQSGKMPDVILIATGSEVHLALEAAEKLAEQHPDLCVRVVSMPSWQVFDRQPRDYRESVLPHSVRARVSVEAGAKLGLEHFVGLDGRIIGLDRFGASGPPDTVFKKLGFTPEHVVEAANEILAGRAQTSRRMEGKEN